MIQKSLHPVALDLLGCLYQHRLCSGEQLRRMVAPAYSEVWIRHLLRRMGPGGMGLIAFVRHRGSNPRVHRGVKPLGRLQLWYLTERGTAAVEGGGSRSEVRRHQLTGEMAAGPLQPHTLAVNEVGLVFLEAAARREGHEFGPWQWRHEWPPLWPERTSVIADAWLRYRIGGHVYHRFLEVDRATMPEDDLADKVARYAALYVSGRWEGRYPSFPEVLVVMSGREAEQLAQRTRVTAGYCQQRCQEALARGFGLSFVLLEDLTRMGPYAEVFVRLDGEPYWADWLGNRLPSSFAPLAGEVTDVAGTARDWRRGPENA
jgi:hypothetical protein